MSYVFAHEDKVFSPDGKVDLPAMQTDQHNQEQEKKELEWLKTGPEKVFLYVGLPELKCSLPAWGSVKTWLGTVLDSHACFGPRQDFPCFGSFPSRRRAVSCRIFGTLYHGWYYESSGDYCRLKKAKRQ